MKKLGWYAVSAVVAGFILGGGILLVANLYVQSRAVQHRIRQALSASLHMPVGLRKTTFTPWDGLRIDGITAQTREAKNGPGTDKSAVVNLLTAHSFRVHFAFAPLLQRQFVIADVLLDQPHLAWMQDDDNRWHLPSEKVTGGKRVRERIPPVDAAVPSPVDTPTAGTPGSTPLPPLANEGRSGAEDDPTELVRAKPLEIQKFRLRHGSMDFMNHRRGLLGRFEDVNVDGRLLSVDHAAGAASFAKASLPRAGIKLARFQSGFVYERTEGLTLSNATADFAGGALKASCRVKTGDVGTPYTAQCQMENVSIDQLIKEAGGSFGLVEGQLQGNIDVSGFSDDPTRNEASGEFRLVDAQVRNLPLFQAIGSALRIDDLQQLRFKTARLSYRVDGNSVEIQPLILVSNNLQIMAQGHYLIREDRLNLHAQLLIDEAVSRQLPQIVERQFTACGDEMPGSRFIDFDIKGPINKPSSNLYQRMLPNALNGLLDSLLRPTPKRAREKPARPVEPAPPPAENDSP